MVAAAKKRSAVHQISASFLEAFEKFDKRATFTLRRFEGGLVCQGLGQVVEPVLKGDRDFLVSANGGHGFIDVPNREGKGMIRPAPNDGDIADDLANGLEPKPILIHDR